MKIRYNKKRNTAFVYEALIREATVAVLKKDKVRRDASVSILKKYFHTTGVLHQDLQCYHSLNENQNIPMEIAEKIIKEVRLQRHTLDLKELYAQQTQLIHEVNKQLSPEVFNNFVVNYKSLATIDQIFSSKTSPKNKVLLEGEVMKHMTGKIESTQMPPVDNILYKTFVDKFNNKYTDNLLEEQQALLVNYIVSFSDNGLDLKLFLNEEIKRLKNGLEKAINTTEIQTDPDMIEKTNRVVKKLDGYTKQNVTEELLLTVLSTQALVKEIYTDGNNN
tara:strand:+ start:7583 stop:8413 length:831 start_codon:yes stop_codon:yes gene_type:complete